MSRSDSARVERLIADERRTITGVEYVDADGKRTALDAQLVIEASGRGDLTLAVLDSLALPRTTRDDDRRRHRLRERDLRDPAQRPGRLERRVPFADAAE